MVFIMTSLLPTNVSATHTTNTKYPATTMFAILKYAGEYDLPVALVTQVIDVESSFNPNAINRHGKYADEGLMQLNNQFSNTYASCIGIDDFDPFNVEHNIWVGCFHLSNIITTQKDYGYKGKELYERALTVYNAGGNYLKKHGIRRQLS